MKIEIKSKKEYHEMMVEIYNLMNKGEGKLTKLESTKLSKMAMAAELYEENILGLKPFKEPEAQPLLYSLLDTFFEIKGIQLSKEPELANGKLDFNCSYTNKSGYIVRTCIEVKNAHHENLIDGLITQLPLYMEASNIESGIFLVLWYKGNNFNFPKYETIEELEKMLSHKIPNNKNIEIIIIDCSKQIAPSKIKSKKTHNS